MSISWAVFVVWVLFLSVPQSECCYMALPFPCVCQLTRQWRCWLSEHRAVPSQRCLHLFTYSWLKKMMHWSQKSQWSRGEPGRSTIGTAGRAAKTCWAVRCPSQKTIFQVSKNGDENSFLISEKISAILKATPCAHPGYSMPCCAHPDFGWSTGRLHDKNNAPICTLQIQCSYLYFIFGAGLEKYWNGMSAERMWFIQCDYWILLRVECIYRQSETWNKEAEQTNPDALMWDELRNSGWARAECLGVMGQLGGC